MIKRVIKLSDGSLGIRFTKQDIERYGIVWGDKVDLGEMLIQGGDDESE